MYNKINLIGYLGGDPELRYTTEGTPVANFSLATNFRAGENEETTWFRVVAWRKLAENCAEYLAKGSLVFVEGRLRVREYEDRNGVTRTAIEVIANDVRFLSKNGGANGGNNEDYNEDYKDEEEDDLPF